ncbi:hypothetical protein EfmAA290_06160 [Enterococcus faecium]|nr:hypothetical protein EfmAA290_06160 [Enterococcus faecium]
MCSVFTNTIIPALSIGVFAILFALFTNLGALVGVGVGVFAAMLILMFFSRDNVLEDLLSVFFAFFLIKRKNSYFFQSDTFTMELEINIDPSLNEE